MIEITYQSIFSEHFTINDVCISRGFAMDGSTPLHMHDFNELMFVLSGSGIQTINGKQLIVTAGDVFVLKSNDIHGIEAQKQISLFNIGYTDKLLLKYSSLMQSMPGYHALFHIDPAFREFGQFKSKLHLTPADLMEIIPVLNALESEFKNHENGCEVMVLGLFLQAVTFASRKYSPGIDLVNPRNMHTLTKALLYIENNLNEAITLEQLSEACNMSVSSFIYTFKKLLNTSPVNYIITLKLKKACELLINSQYSITEIAFRSGFNDSNYFCRTFKKHLKLSPKEFRESKLPIL